MLIKFFFLKNYIKKSIDWYRFVLIHAQINFKILPEIFKWATLQNQKIINSIQTKLYLITFWF